MKSRTLAVGATITATGLLAASGASANVCNFDISTSAISCSLDETSSEVSLAFPNQNQWSTGYYNIFDPASGGGVSDTLSDVLVFANTGSGYVDTITLFSFDDGGVAPPGLPDLTSLTHIGNFTEDANGLVQFSPVLVTGGPSTTDTINISSPPEATPEPLTLSLFGAGLAGAVAMRRRKKKIA